MIDVSTKCHSSKTVGGVRDTKLPTFCTQKDERTHRQTDGLTDGRTDGRTGLGQSTPLPPESFVLQGYEQRLLITIEVNGLWTKADPAVIKARINDMYMFFE